jgi:hypothetical protein
VAAARPPECHEPERKKHQPGKNKRCVEPYSWSIHKVRQRLIDGAPDSPVPKANYQAIKAEPVSLYIDMILAPMFVLYQ